MSDRMSAGRPPTTASPKPRPDVDPSLLPRANAGQNPIRPPGPQPNGQLLRKRQHIPNLRSRSIPNHILHCTDYLTTCLNSATTVFVCVAALCDCYNGNIRRSLFRPTLPEFGILRIRCRQLKSLSFKSPFKGTFICCQKKIRQILLKNIN